MAQEHIAQLGARKVLLILHYELADAGNTNFSKENMLRQPKAIPLARMRTTPEPSPSP